jgi:hypothetical protein
MTHEADELTIKVAKLIHDEVEGDDDSEGGAYMRAARAAISVCVEYFAGVAEEAERQQEIDHGAANTGGAQVAAAAIRSHIGDKE